MIISLSGGISTVSTTDILLHLYTLRLENFSTEPVVVHKNTIAATIKSARVDERKHVRRVGAAPGSLEGVIPFYFRQKKFMFKCIITQLYFNIGFS
jgi:hypothetical protein